MIYSVIVSAWKRPRELKLILTSLQLQSLNIGFKTQVIVADSNSSLEVNKVISDAVIDFNFLEITHIHTENILAAKRNIGLSVAKGQYLIFLDDDCEPSKDFLHHCILQKIDLNEKIVICGEVRFPEVLVKSSNYYRYRDSNHPQIVNKNIELNEWTFVAMNFMISRNQLMNNNLYFDESFVGYGAEDHDYGFKLKDCGFRIVQGQQRIIHHEYDGNINKYTKKIYHSSRDGMQVLKNIYGSKYLRNHKSLTFIENFFSNNSFLTKVVIILFFNNFFFSLISWFLEVTDKFSFLYIRSLYRYLVLHAYIRGIIDRDKSNENDLRKNWYQ